MEHWLSCIPPKVSHHAKRIVRVGKFARLADKMELTAARGDLIAMLLPLAPEKPLDGNLRLKLAYVWPYNAGDRKMAKLAEEMIPHNVKPDCDNLAKTFIDCLTRAAFLTNDSRIWTLHVAKYRWAHTGIFFRLEEWNEPETDVRHAEARGIRAAGLGKSTPRPPVEGGGDGPAQPSGVGADGRERADRAPDPANPFDARFRLCTVCGREGVTTTSDGTHRRCPICQRTHLATARCSACGGPGGVIALLSRLYCRACYDRAEGEAR